MAVHRYKANESVEDEKSVKPAKTTAKKVVSSAKKTTTKAIAQQKPGKNNRAKKERKPIKAFAPLRAIKDYFVGSWRELRQVRWPNRKQTWALTLAVILFSLLLGLLIFLLDAGFTLLFKKVIF